MEKVIEVRGLSFGYNGKLILENVNLTVERGDYLGVIGPNGSGKSTLIKLLLGLVSPFTGEIRILGKNIKDFRNWDKTGYISQKSASFNSNFPATVEEVVAANLFSKVGLFKRPRKQHWEQVHNALEMVGMQDHAKKLIGNLSGGQQQRVFIARMLVSNPEIMFLDEPTAGVDAKSEEAVYCLLARLNRELGITMVMATHDIGAVTYHANKLACMGNKSLHLQKPGEEITEELINELYGYRVNLHIHRHDCTNCDRKEVL